MSEIIFNDEILNKVSNLPSSCGVYIFKNINNEIIYIGKAVNLRSRVRSYFNINSWQDRPKLNVMIPKTHSFEIILTATEKEALLLEATLIRTHKPKYNVTLKDDKKYPWLAISYGENFPRLVMTRYPLNFRKSFPKAKIFGPFVNQGNMWETVKILRKVFPLRQRPKPLFKDRPCLNYHIGLCLAPCQNLVSTENYQKILHELEMFLSGKQNEVINNFKQEMESLAQSLEFETAAKIRDRYHLLQSITQKQSVIFEDSKINLDIFGEYHNDELIVICFMQVRSGKLIQCENIPLNLKERTLFQEAFNTFIDQYYSCCEDNCIPKEILLQHEIEDESALEELLVAKSQAKIKIYTPISGIRQELIKMAVNNARQNFEQTISSQEITIPHDSLKALQIELSLTKIPYRMECFDISNIQGVDNVASMVVFENGQAKKSEYRRFKIKSVEGSPNDFASMKEVITRRYAKANLPDLIVIDGGRGQLNSALEALTELNLATFTIVGLAKRQEEIYFPNVDQPHLLTRNSSALYLMQRIRDEAHRFAITYHRQLRAKRVAKSQLSVLAGIGPKRTKILLDASGSLDNLKKSNLEDLAKVKGISIKIAEKLYNQLQRE